MKKGQNPPGEGLVPMWVAIPLYFVMFLTLLVLLMGLLSVVEQALEIIVLGTT